MEYHPNRTLFYETSEEYRKTLAFAKHGDRSYNSLSYGASTLNSVEEGDEKDDESEENVEKYTSKQKVTFGCMALSNLTIAISLSLQAPFFPAEAEQKGASATEYGFVFGVYKLAMFIFAPVFGKAVANFSPYSVLNTGIFVIGGCSILFGVLNHAPYGKVFIILASCIRITEGIGAVAVRTSSYTIVGFQFPGSVATTFASMETFVGIGMIIGPTLGGFLYEIGGYSFPFLIAGALQLLDAVLVFFLLPRNGGEIHKSGNVSKFLKSPVVLLKALIVFSTYNYIGVNQVSLEPHIRQFGLSPLSIGAVFIIGAIFYGACAPIWGWLCDRGISPEAQMIAGSILCFVSQAMIGPAGFIPANTHLPLVIVSLVLMGIAMSMKLVTSFMSCIRHTLDRGFPNDLTTYSLTSSMYASSGSLGAFVGPILGGYLLDSCGYRWSVVVLMAVEFILIFFACLHLGLSKNKQQKGKPVLIRRRKKSKYESSINISIG